MTGFSRRRGALVLDLLVGLALGVLVIAAFGGVFISTLRWAGAMAGRVEALEVVRTTWIVLDEELRPGTMGRDWNLVDGIVALRAFRGVARVCGESSSGQWAVAFRGRRLPDPERDSILVLGVDGGWRAFDLTASSSGGACVSDSGETSFEWRWAQDGAPPPVLARLYERGDYHLVDGAFRYRRGEGGRQPLTPERLAPGSGFGWSESDALEVRLEFPGEGRVGDPGGFEWSVRGRPSSGS